MENSEAHKDEGIQHHIGGQQQINISSSLFHLLNFLLILYVCCRFEELLSKRGKLHRIAENWFTLFFLSFQEMKTPGCATQSFWRWPRIPEYFTVTHLLIASVLCELLRGNEVLRLPFFNMLSMCVSGKGIHFPNLSCFLSESVSQSLYCSHCFCVVKVINPYLKKSNSI